MTKCNRCGIKMGDQRCGTDVGEINLIKRDTNELPPLCFFKHKGDDYCNACYISEQDDYFLRNQQALDKGWEFKEKWVE